MAESVGRVRGKQGSAGGWREGASLSAGSEQVWVGRLLEGSVGENARMHPGGGAVCRGSSCRPGSQPCALAGGSARGHAPIRTGCEPVARPGRWKAEAGHCRRGAGRTRARTRRRPVNALYITLMRRQRV